MSINNEVEFNGIVAVGQLVARVRDALVSQSKPGVTTAELDEIARVLLDQAGAVSAPLTEYQFPGHTCISIGREAAHGIPRIDRKIQDGDIVNIDISAKLNGYYADTGISFTVGNSPDLLKRICSSAKKATFAGIHQAKTGNFLRSIGRSIHRSALRDGFDVIRNLAGHGTGAKLHEEPQVLNYEEHQDTRKLNRGLVLAIESFITTGSRYVVEGRDGWTLKTKDGSYVAQFEHTVIVTDRGGLVVTG